MNRKYINRIIEQAINIPTGKEKKAPFAPNPEYILPGKEIGLQYRGKEYVWNPATETYWKRPKNGNDFQWRDMQTDSDYYKTSSEIKNAFDKYRSELMDDEAQAEINAAAKAQKAVEKAAKDNEKKEKDKEKDPNKHGFIRNIFNKFRNKQEIQENPEYYTDGSWVYSEKVINNQIDWYKTPLINITDYKSLSSNTWVLTSTNDSLYLQTIKTSDIVTLADLLDIKNINVNKSIKLDDYGNYYLITPFRVYFSYDAIQLTRKINEIAEGPYFSIYLKPGLDKSTVTDLIGTLKQIKSETEDLPTKVRLGDPSKVTDFSKGDDSTITVSGTQTGQTDIIKPKPVTNTIYKEGGGYQYKIENGVYFARKIGMKKWINLAVKKGVNFQKAKGIIDAANTIDPPEDEVSAAKNAPPVVKKEKPAKEKTANVDPAQLKQANGYLQESYNYTDTITTSLNKRVTNFKMSELQSSITKARESVKNLKTAVAAMKREYTELKNKTTDTQVKTLCDRSIVNVDNVIIGYGKYLKMLSEISKAKDAINKGIQQNPKGYINNKFIISPWTFWRPGETSNGGWKFSFKFIK